MGDPLSVAVTELDRVEFILMSRMPGDVRARTPRPSFPPLQDSERPMREAHRWVYDLHLEESVLIAVAGENGRINIQGRKGGGGKLGRGLRN